MRWTFSQVSRSLPLGVWTRYQRTRPCWLLVVAPLKAPGSCSWRRIVCSISRPLPCSATHADAGALRTGFLLAARRSRKSTGFCIFRRCSLYEETARVFPDYTKYAANGCISIRLYKNLYLFAQQKGRTNQRLFFYRQQKRRPPYRTIAFVNSCAVCARRES